MQRSYRYAPSGAWWVAGSRCKQDQVSVLSTVLATRCLKARTGLLFNSGKRLELVCLSPVRVRGNR